MKVIIIMWRRNCKRFFEKNIKTDKEHDKEHNAIAYSAQIRMKGKMRLHKVRKKFIIVMKDFFYRGEENESLIIEICGGNTYG